MESFPPHETWSQVLIVLLIIIANLFAHCSVASDEELRSISAHYVTLPGWCCDITQARSRDDLPENASNYLSVIEKELHIPGMWCQMVSYLLLHFGSDHVKKSVAKKLNARNISRR